MKLFKKFLQWIVSSQLLISIGAGLYYLTGCLLLQAQFTFPLSRFLVILGGTWLTYATFRGILNIHNRKTLTIALYLVYAMFLIYYIPFLEIIFLLHLAILSFLYEPSSFNIKIFSLRKVPLLKLIILSYIWASLSSFYPAITLDVNIFQRSVSNLFWIQFTFILSITIPFDIRDFYLDLKENLITMPRIFGFKVSKYIALTFLVINTILIVNWHDKHYENIIISFLAAILIWHSDRKRSNLYFGLWIDGLLVLNFIFVYIHYHHDILFLDDLNLILFKYL